MAVIAGIGLPTSLQRLKKKVAMMADGQLTLFGIPAWLCAVAMVLVGLGMIAALVWSCRNDD